MKAKAIRLEKEIMDQYLQHIDAEDTNPDLFKFVRSVQDAALEQESVVLSNAGEFYWHLREYRDSLKKGK